MAYRIERLPSATVYAAFLGRLAAILLSLLIAAVAFILAGQSPLALGSEVLDASFGSSFGLEDLGVLLTPLILTGLSVAFALKIGAWNIGADGQFYLGAFAASAVALFIPGPTLAILPLMLLAGALAGALWILIPALARAYADVNELITTLLLNFVASLLVYWVATGPWRDRKTGAQASTERLAHAIPEFWGYIHWGLPIAVLLAIVLWAVLRFTTWGYEVRVSGSNPENARFAGLPVKRHLVTVMLVSGAIAGLAGMFEVAGTVHRLQGGISNEFGYIGIMVAVLARGSLLGVMAGAALMAVVLNAGIVLQTQGVNTNTVLAITGLILFLTAIGDELSHYRLRRVAKLDEAKAQ